MKIQSSINHSHYATQYKNYFPPCQDQIVNFFVNKIKQNKKPVKLLVIYKLYVN